MIMTRSQRRFDWISQILHSLTSGAGLSHADAEWFIGLARDGLAAESPRRPSTETGAVNDPAIIDLLAQVEFQTILERLPNDTGLAWHNAATSLRSDCRTIALDQLRRMRAGGLVVGVEQSLPV